jgi:5-methylcytosine-specific restriction enzyme subunit McrC
MIRFASTPDALRRVPAERYYQLERMGLAEIWCLLLAEECNALLMGGLRSDYRQDEQVLTTLRGRLLPRNQLVRQFGRVDRLECRYEELVTDVAENRLLLAALSLASRLPINKQLSRRLHRLAEVYRDFCELDYSSADEFADRIVYHRRNQHYRPAHTVALILLRGLRLRDIYATGEARAFAFFIDMDPLFEAFATRLVEAALAGTGVRVTRQAASGSIIINATTGRSYKTIRPDILIEQAFPEATLPIDCKYKLYDQRSVDPSDLYQTFLYAYAYRLNPNVLPAAMILYPSNDPSATGVRLAIIEHSSVQAARLRSLPIPVNAMVRHIEESTIESSTQLHDLRQALLAELHTRVGPLVVSGNA